MVVLPAVSTDLSAVVSFYRSVVEAMRGTPYDVYWDMEFHPTEAALRDAIDAGDLFAAFDSSDRARVLGAFVLDDRQGGGYEQASWRVNAVDGEVAVVHLLAVSLQARGTGVGDALVKHAKSVARSRGAASLRLDVLASNEPAVALYLRAGLVDLGIYPLVYGGDFAVTAHLMEFDLLHTADRPSPALNMSTETVTDAEASCRYDLLRGESLAACELCPRRCGADRLQGERGACGAAASLKLARAALHLWEEPPISGEAGSGTIFFSGCPLKCVYCQNHEISTGNFGIEVPPERLVEIMLELQGQGALNINLVTATHYAHLLPHAVGEARRRGLTVPIVYNTSGYERVEAVRELDGIVDIWLTDFKYADAALARTLSHVPDYPERAASALAQMVRQIDARGGIEFDDEGIMRQGLIVRHLVLPGHADDSCRVLDAIWKIAGDVPISVMNQYTPNAAMRAAGGRLAGPVSDEEYERVLDHADALGFTTMYWQEGGAVDESFTPAFDTTGVLAAADGPILPRA